MRVRNFALILLSIAGLAAFIVYSRPVQAEPATQAQETGGSEFGPYELVPNWPLPLPDGPDGVKHEGWTWGSVGTVYAETPDRIWIAQRGELPLPPNEKPWTPYGMLTPPRISNGNDDGLSATCQPAPPRGWQRRYHHVIFVVDRNGKLVQWWSQHDKLFDVPCGRGPHKIKMNPYDPEKHVWVIDDQVQVIYKFTYDGKLVMTLGTKSQRGRDGGKLFDRPTDIAWLPDGTFFISDGYGGTRVAKFDKDGKFLLDWGNKAADPKNPGPNEFNTVHAVAVGKDRRVYVADRGYGRIQVFDENGKFLSMWTTGRPLEVLMSTDQHLWVSDLDNSRIVKYDLSGKALYGWGSKGGAPGQFNCPHGMSVDQENNLYVAECFNGRTQKFRPKPNADRAEVMLPELKPPSRK
jgi:hypothetical protein